MSTFKLVVHPLKQEMEVWSDGQLIRKFRVSTAANGIGCEVGSLKTPLGQLRVAKKIGAGFPMGSVFRSRLPTGEIWNQNPENPLCHSDEDLVLSRILWLEGCEEQNSNTIERFIYIHGTNQENLLGQAASHGCIRLSNRDVVDLYDLIPEGTMVEVADV